MAKTCDRISRTAAVRIERLYVRVLTEVLLYSKIHQNNSVPQLWSIKHVQTIIDVYLVARMYARHVRSDTS